MIVKTVQTTLRFESMSCADQALNCFRDSGNLCSCESAPTPSSASSGLRADQWVPQKSIPMRQAKTWKSWASQDLQKHFINTYPETNSSPLKINGWKGSDPFILGKSLIFHGGVLLLLFFLGRHDISALVLVMMNLPPIRAGEARPEI